MKKEMFISEADLRTLAQELLGAGTRVIAPVDKKLPTGERVEYARVDGPDAIVLNKAVSANSLKEFIMPPTVPLLCWKQKMGQVELTEIPRDRSAQVVIGAHPCDAAALEVVDKVMNWDYHDELWSDARGATTILSLACTAGDSTCFCTAVGLSPDSARGADILLIPTGTGFRADVMTDKGEQLVRAHIQRFKDQEGQKPAPEVEAARKKIAGNLQIDPKAIKGFLDKGFEHEVWKAMGLRCHGCGGCAYVCPTCHCFDIVDEPEGVDHGVRRRNWDTCQTAKFTLHASGHNPRADQNCRIRQRMMHKFFIYPDKFQEILCTGCGRCARVCPGGMDLPEVLKLLSAKAAR